MIIFLPLLILSCSKEQFQDCSKSCVDIKIKGQVKNMETNSGMKDIIVSSYWKNSTFCFFCPTLKKIAKVKTDNLGFFTLDIVVDSSLFKENHIEVSIPTDNINFFYSPDPYGNPFTEFDINSTGSYNFSFQVFPKANLNLNLKYSKNNNLHSTNVLNQFNENGAWYGIYSWYKTINSVQRDTIVKIETASGIFTKIKWTKVSSPGKWIDFEDSIKCEKGKQNEFEITF